MLVGFGPICVGFGAILGPFGGIWDHFSVGFGHIRLDLEPFSSESKDWLDLGPIMLDLGPFGWTWAYSQCGPLAGWLDAWRQGATWSQWLAGWLDGSSQRALQGPGGRNQTTTKKNWEAQTFCLVRAWTNNKNYFTSRYLHQLV